MPRENYQSVHTDRPLTNFSVARFQDPSVFVSGRFFPKLSVKKASDKFDVYPQGYWNRVYDTRRAEESVANSVTYKVRQDSYACGDDALRIFVSDKKRANVDSQRNLDKESTMIVTDAIALGRDVEFANTFLKTGVWGKDVDLASKKWSSDGSDPIATVKEACKDVLLASGGKKPNKMLMTFDVWIKITEHPDLIDRVKYQGTSNAPAMMTKRAVAALFELDEIMVMMTVNNTAIAGVEDSDGNPPVNNEFLATDLCLLGHVPKSVGLMTPCPGITFVWDQYINASAGIGPSMRRYRPMDGRKGEYIEAELSIDQKVVAKDLCLLFHNVV